MELLRPRYRWSSGRRRSASMTITRSPERARLKPRLKVVTVLPSRGDPLLMRMERVLRSTSKYCRLVRSERKASSSGEESDFSKPRAIVCLSPELLQLLLHHCPRLHHCLPVRLLAKRYKLLGKGVGKVGGKLGIRALSRDLHHIRA